MRNTWFFPQYWFHFQQSAPILLPRPIRPIFNEEDTINDLAGKISLFLKQERKFDNLEKKREGERTRFRDTLRKI